MQNKGDVLYMCIRLSNNNKNNDFLFQIRVVRSAAVCQGKGYPKTREQINTNTAYVDASQIYGSTKTVADFLRLNVNTPSMLNN